MFCPDHWKVRGDSLFLTLFKSALGLFVGSKSFNKNQEKSLPLHRVLLHYSTC